jgi:bacterioferritin (cytochrome b1)
MNDYLIFTSISHFRMRHALPISYLKEHQLTDDETLEEIAERLLNGDYEIPEISQYHIGIDIVDSDVCSSDELLKSISEDENAHMKEWVNTAQLEYINKM